MLSVSSYPTDHVATARARLTEVVDAYERAAPDPALEPLVFNHLVLALDGYFTHRARGQEGKDGNALNEVRVLCTSLTTNGGLLVKDKQIKLTPERSVLGLAPGDEIRVTASDFRRLATAFLDEIEQRFSAQAA